jgi:hypothetical protein
MTRRRSGCGTKAAYAPLQRHLPSLQQLRYLSLEESLEGETTGGCYLWKHTPLSRAALASRWSGWADCGSPFESQNCLLFCFGTAGTAALRSLQLDTWFCAGAVKPGDPRDGNASAGSACTDAFFLAG